ncbi:MAG: LysM peptidoglycan-binding domain-containing protein [Opitutales bacterium]
MHCDRRQFTKTSLLAGAACLGFGSSLTARANGVYVVEQGDTLSHIAHQHGVSLSSLRQANHISGDLIRVGQKLNIPGGSDAANPTPKTYHIVSRGDTLSGISIRYGVSVSQIKRDNGLRNDMIRIGQKLTIAGGSRSSSGDYLGSARSVTSRIHLRRDNWQRIVVHHSAIKHGNAAKYDAAHRRRGMHNGLAYHFVIGNGIDSGDGEIEVGPRWKKQLLGGHVKSYQTNLTAIGICLVGNFEETHPSRRQLDAFTQLMDWLRGDVVPKARKFAGHKELKGEQTICPGKNFPLRAMHARYG